VAAGGVEPGTVSGAEPRAEPGAVPGAEPGAVPGAEYGAVSHGATGGGPGVATGAAAGAGAGAAAGRGLWAAVRAIVSARTWLAVIHLIVGFFLGTLFFVVLVTGAAVGVGLLPVFLIGLPVLLAVFGLSWAFARAERARFALLLGARIAAPPRRAEGRTAWRRAWRAFTTPSAYREFGYALLRFPLSILQAVVLAVGWSSALALVTLPAYNGALPQGGAHLDGYMVHGPAALAVAAVAGLALLLVAPQLTRALAVADAAIAGWFLGPHGEAQLTARIGELETSRARVVDSAEAERRRIERDLHDGAQQRLVSLAMELGRARAKFATDPDAAAAIVGQAHEQAKEALAELRNLVRGMHPPVLTDRGLDAALSGLAALSPVPVTVRVDVAVRPPAAVEAIAYFVVAEALTNIAKHAQASRAEVIVSRSGDLLKVAIRDDGIGGADPAGQGLSGLAGRVAGVDGRLAVSSPAGGPTSIEVLLPCVS
jgi:signal transduction histidine kinase